MSPLLAAADRQALYGYALRLTHDRALADDLVQDTMVRALRYEHSFRPGANVGSWLRTILRNVFVDGWHRDRRALALRCTLRTCTPASHTPDLDDVPALVASAIAALPDDQRIAVTLREIDGLTYAEIAEQTGVPIGTVMSRLRRGRTRLHVLLAGHADELGLTTSAARPRFRH